jgi:hypothetical protein
MTRRLGLYGPFIVLAIAAAAGSFGWLWLKGETERKLDALSLNAAGGGFTWVSRRVSGYPFHIDVDFRGATWRDPSGWGVTVPVLNAEASVFAPDHWVGVAPDGAVLTRPTNGSVRIFAKVLRASLSDLAAHPARFSLEGIGLAFSPVPGAAPYFLDRAGELHIHTRAGPADQGAFYAELDQATPRAGSPLAALAAGKPVSLIADAIYAHAGALAGASWADGVRAWSAGGGTIEARRVNLAAGGFRLDARGEGLTVGDDGRLQGALSAKLVHASQALASLADEGTIPPDVVRTATVALGAQGTNGPVDLNFQAGRMTLGPVALMPAPKVY